MNSRGYNSQEMKEFVLENAVEYFVSYYGT